MKIFEYMTKYNYEQMVVCQDEASGLKAIICIHDTTLGRAVGGTRMWNYKNEEDAVLDVLRLARGMTYKMAAAGLNVGGGKGVIIADSASDKSEALFRAYGRFIQSLNGRFGTAEDVGTTPEDMHYVRMETDYVYGLESTSGDPSPVTAHGVWKGIKACTKEVWGSDSLRDKIVAVQGVGHVGRSLCRNLKEDGARLIVSDVNEDSVKSVVKEFGAEAVSPEEIFSVNCDIFAPCALGAVINDETIPKLKCRIVAGAANNQLKEERHGDILSSKKILYAPDYVINAGGAISVCEDMLESNYDRKQVLYKVDKIYSNIEKVIVISKRDNIPTYKAANKMVEERIQIMRKVKRLTV